MLSSILCKSNICTESFCGAFSQTEVRVKKELMCSGPRLVNTLSSPLKNTQRLVFTWEWWRDLELMVDRCSDLCEPTMESSFHPFIVSLSQKQVGESWTSLQRCLWLSNPWCRKQKWFDETGLEDNWCCFWLFYFGQRGGTRVNTGQREGVHIPSVWPATVRSDLMRGQTNAGFRRVVHIQDQFFSPSFIYPGNETELTFL